MKSLVWQGPERMSVEETAEPVAGAGKVVLHVGAAGICGSEVEGYLGRMGNRNPPLVMGHEFAGTVVSVGEGVAASWEGKRATVNPLLACGECRLCRSGLDNICQSRTMIGIQHPGGFAEYVLVPEPALREVPDGLTIEAAALAEPFANGVHAVRLGLERGPVERAVVVGGGTIGVMCMQAAILRGIPHVSVVELHDGRREQVKTLGASATFASGEEAIEAEQSATDGLGADLVMDAVGAGATRQLAADLARPGGTAVLVGLHEDETAITFHNVVRRQVALQGSYAYTRADFDEGLRLLSEGRAVIGALSPPLPLERGPEAFAELVRGPSEQIKVFLAEGEAR